MICPHLSTSDALVECLKDKCPLWVTDTDGNTFCVTVTHQIIEFLLARRMLSEAEQNELLNKKIVESKSQSYQ